MDRGACLRRRAPFMCREGVGGAGEADLGAAARPVDLRHMWRVMVVTERLGQRLRE